MESFFLGETALLEALKSNTATLRVTALNSFHRPVQQVMEKPCVLWWEFKMNKTLEAETYAV